jgi:succinate-acetate transporter protein
VKENIMADQEHVFANPMPAGLGALAMACYGFFAVLSGNVSHDAAPLLAIWLLGGFFVQLVVAIIEFRDKNMPGANVFLVFSCIFMLVGGMSIAGKFFLHRAGIPFDPTIEGWLWLGIGLWLFLIMPCFLKSPRILFFLGSLLCITVICLIALDMGVKVARPLIAQVGAWCLLVAGSLAIYLSGAIALNTHFGRQILPISTPLVK